jgi:hypothetical protein
VTITRDWAGWYNRMPGVEDPNLHVSGLCELTSGSKAARLELRPDGIVDEPGVVTFALVSDTPEFGDDRMSEITALWEVDVGPDIKTVRVRIPDGDDVAIEVTIAT